MHVGPRVRAATGSLRVQRYKLHILVVAILLAAGDASADSLVFVTSQAGQSANDSISWSQLGANLTVLGSSASVTSSASLAATVTLAGPNSIISVVCPAASCSWSGSGFTAGDSLIWTSDAANGGNGPLTLSFGKSISGAGP